MIFERIFQPPNKQKYRNGCGFSARSSWDTSQIRRNWKASGEHLGGIWKHLEASGRHLETFGGI